MAKDKQKETYSLEQIAKDLSIAYSTKSWDYILEIQTKIFNQMNK